LSPPDYEVWREAGEKDGLRKYRYLYEDGNTFDVSVDSENAVRTMAISYNNMPQQFAGELRAYLLEFYKQHLMMDEFTSGKGMITFSEQGATDNETIYLALTVLKDSVELALWRKQTPVQ